MKKQRREIIDEIFVVDSVINYLKNKGWSLSLKKAELHEKGVDIKVKNDKFSRYFLIEAKGDPKEKVKSPLGSISSNVNSAIAQIISRMHTDRKRGYKYGYKYGVAFPTSHRNKVLKSLPYDVMDKLNMHIFLVDNSGNVEEFGYKEVKNKQIEK